MTLASVWQQSNEHNSLIAGFWKVNLQKHLLALHKVRSELQVLFFLPHNKVACCGLQKH